MIKINGNMNYHARVNNLASLYANSDFIVELDIDSFNDICEENMSIEESDKLIEDAIIKKYGVTPV